VFFSGFERLDFAANNCLMVADEEAGRNCRAISRQWQWDENQKHNGTVSKLYTMIGLP
jgi:hypothetical protein